MHCRSNPRRKLSRRENMMLPGEETRITPPMAVMNMTNQNTNQPIKKNITNETLLSKINRWTKGNAPAAADLFSQAKTYTAGFFHYILEQQKTALDNKRPLMQFDDRDRGGHSAFKNWLQMNGGSVFVQNMETIAKGDMDQLGWPSLGWPSNTCTHIMLWGPSTGLLTALDLLCQFFVPALMAMGASSAVGCATEIAGMALAANVAAVATPAGQAIEPEIGLASAIICGNITVFCAAILSLEAMGTASALNADWIRQQLLCTFCHALDSTFTPSKVDFQILCPGNPCELGVRWQNTLTPGAGHSYWPWEECKNECKLCDGKSSSEDPAAYKTECSREANSVCVNDQPPSFIPEFYRRRR